MPSRNRSPRRLSARCDVDLCRKRAGLASNLSLDLGRQVLVGKIDRRLEMRQQSQQTRAPAAVERAKIAVELAQRLAPLRLGLGRDEIGDRLGLRQVELAVEKGAAGEFAGLGEAQPHPTRAPPISAARTARLPCT